MNKRTLLLISCLITVVFSFPANSEETSGNKLSFAQEELVMGAVSALVAQDPKGFGSYTICCIALLAGFWEGAGTDSSFNWPTFFIYTGSFVAYGRWNISMHDEDKGRVFLNNFLFFNAIAFVDRARKQKPESSESKNHSQVFLAPTNDGGTLVYDYRF